MHAMKIQITLLTGLLGFAAGKSPELDPASFDEAIHSKNVFVKFYAPVSAFYLCIGRLLDLHVSNHVLSPNYSGAVIANLWLQIGIN